MPEISRFHGIIIRMFHREHSPPHLHAQFGEYEITVDIETSDVHGQFPLHALHHIVDWTESHRAELFDCWLLAREGKPIPRIPPLE